jgi:hypothetical protein
MRSVSLRTFWVVSLRGRNEGLKSLTVRFDSATAHHSLSGSSLAVLRHLFREQNERSSTLRVRTILSGGGQKVSLSLWKRVIK